MSYYGFDAPENNMGFDMFGSGGPSDSDKKRSMSIFITYICLSLVLLIIICVQVFLTLKNADPAEQETDTSGMSAKTGINIALIVISLLTWGAAIILGFSQSANTELWAKIMIVVTTFLQVGALMYARGNFTLTTAQQVGYNITILLTFANIGFGVIGVPNVYQALGVNSVEQVTSNKLSSLSTSLANASTAVTNASNTTNAAAPATNAATNTTANATN